MESQPQHDQHITMCPQHAAEPFLPALRAGAEQAVDFEALRTLVAAEPAKVASLVGLDERKRPDHPAEGGTHASCGDYAGAISDLALAADRHLFRAFKFSSCCGARG